MNINISCTRNRQRSIDRETETETRTDSGEVKPISHHLSDQLFGPSVEIARMSSRVVATLLLCGQP